MSFFGNRRQVETNSAPPVESVQITKPSLPQPAVGFDTVLGPNSVLEGTFQSNANVRLDGTFSGALEINGNILVGETAKIKADINARNISVAGAVRGNITLITKHYRDFSEQITRSPCVISVHLRRQCMWLHNL